MKKTVKILIVLSVVFVILGIALCIGGAMAGGLTSAGDILKNFSVGHGELNLEITDETHVEEIEPSLDDVQQENVFDISEILGMDIEVAAAELTFMTAETEEIAVIPSDPKVEVFVKNQTLCIRSDSKLKNYEILIQIPQEFTFREVDINAGASSIQIEKLLADSLDIEIGAGVAYIELIEAAESEFEVGAGEIQVQKGQLKDCSVNIGLGNFEYQGVIERECDIECDMGNAQLRIEEADQTDYNYEIEVGAGSVTIAGESFGGLTTEKVINNRAAASMDIECAVGSVNIEFEGGSL